ncbi:MAG: glycosyl hydrolase, partial [Flammeovirgaceae bacterium]|nr:glycosyl hydrolase [Flammeovirgaceae bacterium]MDW8287627.1 glycosyl hydrolase [Flammeovirgaceae bacterium]
LLLMFYGAIAQKTTKKKGTETIVFTPASERWKGFERRKQLKGQSLVRNVSFRCIGPTIMSGRVVDVDVNPNVPSQFYVAFASGGLWYTESNGTDFIPLFDQEASMTIGDIAVDWKSGTIWVGTGENNSSRSSYAGTGVYKSMDKGKTWQYLGLAESHHIGRIVLHPENSEVAWVAVIGHLYSLHPERGVFKTTDGGKTWKKTLFINDSTGVIDLVLHPTNRQTLYAASWERHRTAWHFKGSGMGSGIYKSTDGGETWQKMTVTGCGFPVSSGVGRIGLAVSPARPQSVWAVLDNQEESEKKEKDEGLTKEKLRNMSREEFLTLKESDLNAFLDRHNFPSHYNATDILMQVKNNQLNVRALVEYLEDANSMLFDISVKGAEVYRSDDEGKTWMKTHEGSLDDVFYTYGYYFGQIAVHAQNADKIYVLGVPIIVSDDGGKTWRSIHRENVHLDHHALWLHPTQQGYFVLGNDGGINISYDDGKTYFKCNPIPVGQFYSVNVDMATPYNVYGGLQDNGVWVGSSQYKYSPAWQQEGKYPYQSLMGGDGMQVAIDTRNNTTIYTGYQFGNYYKIDRLSQKTEYITPRHQLGERPFRFNWQTPIHLSVHNQDVLYMASNRFHRSLDGGKTFQTLTQDLTTGGKKGNVPYGTATTLHESPIKFGLLYLGTDDGLVYVSKDAGYTWELITTTLPQGFWVSRVQASRFDEGRVYCSLNGYRNDNFEALCFVSNDYGRSWQRIGLDLPLEPVNVIKEDTENENVLYVGTDNGLYVSLDKGKTFQAFDGGLPAVAVHDLVIHPREKELVVGTHGRSIWIADIQHVQQLRPEILAKELHFFDIKPLTKHDRWGGKSWNRWLGFEQISMRIPLYSSQSGEVLFQVKTENGIVLQSWKDTLEVGLNYAAYDVTVQEDAV